MHSVLHYERRFWKCFQEALLHRDYSQANFLPRKRSYGLMTGATSPFLSGDVTQARRFFPTRMSAVQGGSQSKRRSVRRMWSRPGRRALLQIRRSAGRRSGLEIYRAADPPSKDASLPVPVGLRTVKRRGILRLE